jgi:hypothetical protein
MTIERFILRFAGSMVLISLLLAWAHSHHWLWLTAFVGANMVQSSFTGVLPNGQDFESFRHELRRHVSVMLVPTA